MRKSFLPPDLFLWMQYSAFRVILFCIISIGIFARWGGWQWRPLVVCFMIWSIIFWRSYRRWWVISMLILWAIIGSSIIWIERWSESLAVILYYSMCATVIVWLFEWSKISVFSTKLWWWLDNKLDSLSKRSIEWIDRWYQQIIQKHTTISLILNHINNNSLAYVGGILLLLIRWPLLDRGWYLHMLDFTTTKHIFRSDVTTLRWFFLKITSFIVPTRIGEKILRIGWFVIGWKGIVECCRILNIQSKWIHRYALCLLWIGYGYGWWWGTYVNYPIGSWPATVTTNGNTTPTTIEIKNYVKRVLQFLGWENSWNGWNTDGGTVTTTEEGLVLPGSLPDTGAWN